MYDQRALFLTWKIINVLKNSFIYIKDKRISAKFSPARISSSRMFLVVLHLYGARGDTKIWAKLISYPSAKTAVNNTKTPKKPRFFPISETSLQKRVAKQRKLR